MAVVLDPVLREILACPCPDHSALEIGTPWDPSADALTCTTCRRSFPVENGIPVLLLDEAISAPGHVSTGTTTTGGDADSPGAAP